MTSPLGFAFRLQRGALIGWTVGLFLMGFVYGSVAKDIERMLDENEVMAEMLAAIGTANVTDAFFAAAITQLGLLVGAYAIASTLRLATEESGGRAEAVLATPTGRVHWCFSHLAIAISGSVVALAAAGLGLGVSYAVISQDAGQIPRLVGAALVALPAVLVLVGVTIALFGAVPTAVRTSWAVFGAMATVNFFGQVMGLPEWALSLSAFEHLPALPGEEMAPVPILMLTLLATALIGTGLWSFRRRDLRPE